LEALLLFGGKCKKFEKKNKRIKVFRIEVVASEDLNKISL